MVRAWNNPNLGTGMGQLSKATTPAGKVLSLQQQQTCIICGMQCHSSSTGKPTSEYEHITLPDAARLTIQGQELPKGNPRVDCWGQALQCLDCCLEVQPGQQLHLHVQRGKGGLHFALPAGQGQPVPRAPFKVSHS